jgi:hypothetical protein
MHANFADWYELLSVKMNLEMLPLRWKSVESLAKHAQIDDVPEFIRIFYSLPASADLTKRIRDALRNDDPSFLTIGSDKEISIIAGAVLEELITRRSGKESNVVALGLVCMEVQGVRAKPRIQAIIDAAAVYLASESVRVRSLKFDPIPALNDVGLTEAAKAETASVTDVATLWTATNKQVRRLVTMQNEHIKTLNATFNMIAARQREQSDILWWLFAEHTLDKEPFSKLTVPQACFRGAKDLADLTQQIPGPFAAPAFLHRMIGLVGKTSQSTVTLTNALADTGLEWKQAWADILKLDALYDICPCLFALVKSVEVGGSNGWHDAFEHKTRLSPNLELPPAQLATQIYNEALFLRSLNGL